MILECVRKRLRAYPRDFPVPELDVPPGRPYPTAGQSGGGLADDRRDVLSNVYGIYDHSNVSGSPKIDLRRSILAKSNLSYIGDFLLYFLSKWSRAGYSYISPVRRPLRLICAF